MTKYVRRNLVADTSEAQGGNYRVACVGHDGREYWVKSHLPAGTAIFASRVNGRPILKLACGNPMVSSLPPGLQIADDNGSAAPPKFAFVPPPALMDSTPMAGLMTEDVTPTDLVVASADAIPAVVLVSDFPPVGPLGTGLSRSFNALPVLLGGIAVAVASSGHHGSTPNGTPAPGGRPGSFHVALSGRDASPGRNCITCRPA